MRPAAVLLVLLVSASALAQEPAYVPPTERYGLSWGDAPEEVVARFGRPPDAEAENGTLTYVGRGGGQALFVFEGGRLAVVVDATPSFASEDEAVAEYARFKAALSSRYGPPVLDESPRPDSPDVVDTVWEPGGDVRAVELTRDAVRDGSEARPFFYVRVVGPVVDR